MTDPTDPVDAKTDEVGDISLQYEPLPGGKIRLAAKLNGTTLENADYSEKVLSEPSIRAQFLNSVEESLKDREGVDAEGTRSKLNEWFAQANEIFQEDNTEFVTNVVSAIIDGTNSVEVHGGETTVWRINLTYAGRTCDLEFTATEMVTDTGKALREKIANHFYEFVDIEKEDWQKIRKKWQEEKDVVNVIEETASDSVADRVLEYLSNNLKAVANREDMGNDVAAVWYDETNETALNEADTDAAIAWVQDSFLIDQLETAGKKADYKPQLIQDLTARGDLFRGNLRRKWGAWGTRTKVYPFRPEAIGVTPDDVGGTDDPAHSEVSA